MSETESVQAYCVRCKEKRDMSDPTNVVTKNGTPAVSGACSVCGSKMFKFLKRQ